MPQAILPMFSEDMLVINAHFAVLKRDSTVYWFQGNLPVFCHHESDEDLFRLFCCQLINIGNVSSAELGRALGVNHEKLSRWARLERESPQRKRARGGGSSKKKPMS